MALDVVNIDRVFMHGKIKLSDPDPAMGTDAVLNFYANTYPELTSATVTGPEINNNQAAYSFKTTIGTKG